MRKLLFAGLIGLLLGGCAAQPYHPKFADPDHPTRPALTTDMRTAIALAVMIRNPGVTFEDASISDMKLDGYYDIGIAGTGYHVCTRWRGTTISGRPIEKYTLTRFRDGKSIGSREQSYDPCTALLVQANYKPFPELLELQRKIHSGPSAARKKH